MVFGFADVQRALNAPSFARTLDATAVPKPASGPYRDYYAMISDWMLFMDPPRHTLLRSSLARAMLANPVERLTPLIETTTAELLERAIGAESWDLVADFAFPLPATVIAVLIGAPSMDLPQLRTWGVALATAIGVQPTADDLQRANDATRSLRAYFGELFDERRRQPRADLVSALLAWRQDGRALGDDELFGTLSFLLIAGHETVTNLIATGTLALLRRPEQLERLRREPALMDGAVEELLRFESPVQMTTRIVREPVELGGRTVARGERVELVLGAANRDPAEFERPDELDVGRDARRHVAFAHGSHYCLGAQLARMEARAAFSLLIRRCPDLRADERELRWRSNAAFRGLARLPVRT